MFVAHFVGVSLGVSWVFVAYFVGVRGVFRGCSLYYRNPFAMFWQSVRNEMADHKQP
ncbi:hypothetical protein [Prevotella pallens]|uniref:hypothetical protein n=1 Tax=Prevotella pallens TaxID=60133 RepID=UPI001CB1451F|nr:hypothetical protein [Prevotella pallens]MBF1510977.1 hypothetical protein [Prevotella pallens]